MELGLAKKTNIQKQNIAEETRGQRERREKNETKNRKEMDKKESSPVSADRPRCDSCGRTACDTSYHRGHIPILTLVAHRGPRVSIALAHFAAFDALEAAFTSFFAEETTAEGGQTSGENVNQYRAANAQADKATHQAPRHPRSFF